MITKEMSITDAVQSHPESVEVFLSTGCIAWDAWLQGLKNIEQGALAHGINVDELMEDLNKAEKSRKIIPKMIRKINLRNQPKG